MSDPKPPHDVDALARRLTRREPAAERSLAMRHAIVDAAQGQGEPVQSARGWWIGFAAAAAAGIAAWLVLRGPTRPSAAPPPAVTVASSGAPIVPASPGSAAMPALAAAPTVSSTAPTAPAVAPTVASAAPAASSSHASLAPTPMPAAGGAAPTAVVASVPDGRIPDGVTAFATNAPLYVTGGDATITAPPAARFDVEVRGNQVKRITVTEGWVVVAGARATTTIVPMRYTWTPEPSAPEPAPPPALPPPAPAITAAAPRSVPPPAPAITGDAGRTSSPIGRATPGDAGQRSSPRDRHPGPASSPAPRQPADPYGASPPGAGSAPRSAAAGSPAHATEPVPGPASGAPPAPLPAAAERDFRDGLRTLLAGDPAAATAALDRACGAPSNSQDDGCYWAAVAWLRSGDHTRARRGLSDLLARWPGSPHVGEANVALGWLLLEVGDTAGARTRFAAAAADRLESVRASALRGLAAAQ